MKYTGTFLLSVAALFAASAPAMAQSYSLTPNDTINITGLLEDLQTLSIQQVNTSPDTIQLQWEKVSESVPPLWDAVVCDNVLCYTSLADSGLMNPVIPTDYGFLLLHITPHVNLGTAIVRYAVWDTANAGMKDTLTFMLTAVNATGIEETSSQNLFCIYPNPANETFTLDVRSLSDYEYIITDAAGKEMERGNVTPGKKSISISAWKKGLYSVSILNKEAIVQTRMILISK